MSVTYERQTPEARSSRASAQSQVYAKRRLRDLGDAEGPPDKRKDFGRCNTVPLCLGAAWLGQKPWFSYPITLELGMGALGSCSSLFQEYTVHTSCLFFLYRVSSYPIQKEKNIANPTSLSGGKRPRNWNPQVWKDVDRQTCELSLGNNQERFSGFAKHPECSVKEGIQVSWRKYSKCFTVVTTISTGLQHASWKVTTA